MRFSNKIKRFLGLSASIANAEFKLRNEGSYLGILWYLLNPILLFTLLFFIFKDRLSNDIPSYHLYLLLGIIMFNLFQEASLDAARAIKNYSGIIKSIDFPKESLIGAILLRRLYSHFFEVILFILIIFLFGGSMAGLLYYPLILILFLAFIYGACLILSSLVVYFVDLDNMWGFFVRLLWLATPIFYSIGGQNRLLLFNIFNPLYYFINLGREVVIYQNTPSIWLVAGAFLYSAIFLLAGIIVFTKLKSKFAELI